MGERPRAALALAALTGLLAFAASASSLLWRDDGSPFSFTTVHGQVAEIAGRGLYRNDTVFFAAAFTGTDIVTLAVALPLLAVALWLTLRGSLRGAFVLSGALSFFLYNGASMALGAAYNPLFLLYIALFSTALFAFGLAFRATNSPDVPARVGPGMPHRALAIFLVFAGVATGSIWLSDVVGALRAGQVPELLGPYTTKITYSLDIGIIMPVCVVSGVLLWRRAALGYAMAFPMLFLCMLIGVMVVAQTAVQYAAGISFHPAQFVIFVSSWVAMSLFAAWLTVAFLRNLEAAPPAGR
ncbi:MAG TPA: hypothetical protein PKD53_23725 [Chloroflexaceae bacterium]|nr:hypothetical protein [Chloroflexaceae bacterium]